MAEQSIIDVLIIGGGPAGLSAALALARQRHTITLFDSQEYRNRDLQNLHLVPSWEHKPAEEVSTTGRSELQKYDNVQIELLKVESAKKLNDSLFELTDALGGSHRGRKLVLANGVEEMFPDVKGYNECWGNSIFYNPFCNGYEESKEWKTSGVLAMQIIAIPKFAVHIAHMAAQLTTEITIYTNGSEDLAKEIMANSGPHPTWKTDPRAIQSLRRHSETGSGIDVIFEDGASVTEGFISHMPSTRARGLFAEQLGLEVGPSGDYVVTAPMTATNVGGVYAAGDCMSFSKVATNAIFNGALTGATVAIKLQEEKFGLTPIF
ncbi:Thioredoxin reductase [Lachnellula willkommii]|uniref:Thioredoxin reductase n=1 Tax=Lachnellula willkommii TaxID=215461 RepID=A0A559MDU3_9HELO|nr:Thioredoxin reductase [Lachnellula willkommii]